MHDGDRVTDGVDALLMSGMWRTAVLEFLRGTRDGWTAAELARWLVGPYREATRHVPRLESPQASARVTAGGVLEIMASARTDVVGALRTASWGAGPELVGTAIRDGAIVPTTAGFWIPLDHERMRLRDRVLALVACDYLLKPQDYVREFVVCAACGVAVFDPAARATGFCGAHRVRGLFAPAHDVPGTPENADKLSA